MVQIIGTLTHGDNNMKDNLTPKEAEYLAFLSTPKTTRELQARFGAKDNAVWQITRALRLKGRVVHKIDSHTWRAVEEEEFVMTTCVTEYQYRVLEYLFTPCRTTEMMEYFGKTYSSMIQLLRTLQMMGHIESVGRCAHPNGKCFEWVTTAEGHRAMEYFDQDVVQYL